MVNMTTKDNLTEEKIFEAATDVFLEKGMDGARMQEIADTAGINKSLLHYYFRSKDKLFNAVFEKIATKLALGFSPILSQELTLDDKLRFFFKEHIALLQKNPRLPAFVLNEINRNPERVKKFIAKLDVNKLWATFQQQHSEDIGSQRFSVNSLIQIITTVASMSVFPFLVRNVIEGFLEQADLQFKDFLEARKEFAAEFVIAALKNKDLGNTVYETSCRQSTKKSAKK